MALPTKIEVRGAKVHNLKNYRCRYSFAQIRRYFRFIRFR